MAVTTAANRGAPVPRYARRSNGLWDVNMGGAERLASLLGAGALVYLGWRRRGALGTGLMALGGWLAVRGATGHSFAYQALGLAPDAEERQIADQRGWSSAVNIERSITIKRPRDELYRFYRNFENLPRFMTHIERIDPLSDRRSHWVVRAPAGRKVEWDAEIEDERENERIAWRSIEGGDIRNTGVVEFRDAPGDRGTEIRVRLSYEPPMGPLGRGVAMLFREEPGQQAHDDLRHLKQLMEAGEIPTTEGQPSGRW
ncbi:SRPBCC family protein [Virgifigura deserti]|uniref:SRPBCC family protein n=1 Tax=Virgifigura deserti TaxID=2268457 RepID=UPI003CCBDE49